MLTTILDFFMPWYVRAGGIALLAGLLVGSCMVRDAALRKEGEKRAVATIRKGNDDAVQTAASVRARSRDGGVRGIRDPHTVD